VSLAKLDQQGRLVDLHTFTQSKERRYEETTGIEERGKRVKLELTLSSFMRPQMLEMRIMQTWLIM